MSRGKGDVRVDLGDVMDLVCDGLGVGGRAGATAVYAVVDVCELVSDSVGLKARN